MKRPTMSNNKLYQILQSVKTEIFNHINDESIPYLQQHKPNPVNWHPYSDLALEKALVEDKLIFLSIRYSTCHWCHVTKSESFEDKEIAAILNENYIPLNN